MDDNRKKFIQIFSGLDRAYGQTQSRSKNESGKLEAKSWIDNPQASFFITYLRRVKISSIKIRWPAA